MTSEDFVQRIQITVYESAINGMVSLLQRVPGRRPSPTMVQQSEWFNRLKPEDQEHVRTVIQFAVRKAVFGMLTVLDGDRSIRKPDESLGTLELRYNAEGQSILLNDPNGEPLHDIFSGKLPMD